MQNMPEVERGQIECAEGFVLIPIAPGLAHGLLQLSEFLERELWNHGFDFGERSHIGDHTNTGTPPAASDA